MKKLLSLILALIIAASLVGCSLGTGEENSSVISEDLASSQVTSSEPASSEPASSEPASSEPEHIHSYAKAVTKPTCTKKGYTTYKCECGDSYVSNYVAMKDHSYSETVTPPTYTEKGYTTYKCTVCGHSYVSNYVNVLRKTSGFTQFEITYYWGPHGTQVLKEDVWKKVAECGFTSVPLENNYASYNKTALNYMKKYGLTCSALWDTRIDAMVQNGATMTDAQLEAEVRKVVDDYATYDNIVGWWLFDEPGAGRFETLGRITAAFKKIDPKHEVFIDLYPTYANASSQLQANDYYDYVDKYLATVNPGYVCYDHYHFKANGKHSNAFFTNFEIIREKSLAKKLDYMSIILLTQHGNMANLTRSQILWEANMCLTYGAKRISYFTFINDPELIAQGWDNACMSYTGELYPHYYDVQAINKIITPLGNELFDKLSVGVYHLTSNAASLQSECEAYTSYGRLGAVEGDGFVIGFFDDGSFMITNKKYEEGDAGKNALVFGDISSGLEYFDTESASWKEYTAKDASGNFIFEANGGEGVLFRVK